MKVRNLKRNPIGAIDLELEHPDFGWVPFTASPNDPEEHGRIIFKEAEEGKLGPIEGIEK